MEFPGRHANELLLGLLLAVVLAPTLASGDETCMSPYMAKIVGQEDFIYVWTLGSVGVGDEQDKLVTVDVRPGSETYGKVVHSLSVGGRNEAHHSGLTDDRRYLWAGGLDTNRIFVFDVHSDPAKPSLERTIDDPCWPRIGQTMRPETSPRNTSSCPSGHARHKVHTNRARRGSGAAFSSSRFHTFAIAIGKSRPWPVSAQSAVYTPGANRPGHPLRSRCPSESDGRPLARAA